MNNARIALCLGILVIALSAPAHAVVDDFEDLGPNFTVVTERIIDGVTVDIATTSGNVFYAVTYFNDASHSFTGAGDQINAPANPAAVSGTRFISTAENFNFDVPIIFTFSVPLEVFGLTTLDILEDIETTPDAEVRLQGFDGPALVAEHVRSGHQGGSGLDLDWQVDYSGGMTHAVLLCSAGAVSPGYGIDDLVVVVATVPTESQTWAEVKALYR